MPSPTSATADDSPEVLARVAAELDLVDLIARQMVRRAPPPITLDDLRSFGHEGLLQAARTFEPSRGVPFRRWANLRVRGAMIDGIRQWGALPRRVYRELRAIEAGDRMLEAYDEDDAARSATAPEEADRRLTTYLEGIATAVALGTVCVSGAGESGSWDQSENNPERALEMAESAQRLRAIVEALAPRERSLIERHYFAGDTLEAAAAALGLSKSWGSRLHARAIENIARELRRQGGR